MIPVQNTTDELAAIKQLAERGHNIAPQGVLWLLRLYDVQTKRLEAAEAVIRLVPVLQSPPMDYVDAFVTWQQSKEAVD